MEPISYRVRVWGYVDVLATSVEDANNKARKCIILTDPHTETFACLIGPEANISTIESPRD